MAEAYRAGRWSVHTADSVDSTQKWVKQRISALSDRSVFLASSQTSGRGRVGRRWESPSGGFYASFLLKPAPPVSHAPCVSLLSALILVRIMDRHGIDACVKWPNDVLVNGRKLAGIIAETGSTPESWFILGTGVNLSTVPDIPGRESLHPGAWKMFGEPPAPEVLLCEFLNELESTWPSVDIHPLSVVLEELQRKLWNLGNPVTVQSGEEITKGVIKGLDLNGSLLLSTNSGERRFVSGELLTVLGGSVEK